MKPGTENKLKFRMLKKLLNKPHYEVVGILESLWGFTAINSPNGDLSAFTPERICAGIEYDGDAKELVRILVEERWLDRPAQNRLVVHDWMDHCPDYVRLKVKRAENTEDKPPVSEKRRKVSENVESRARDSSPPYPAQRSAALPSAAQRSDNSPPQTTARTPAPADAEKKPPLAYRLAAEISAHSRNSPSATDTAARAACLQSRIDQLGEADVEAAVRWWLEVGRTEQPGQFGRITRYADAFAVSGEVDRIEQALRQLGDQDDEEEDAPPTPRTLPPEEVFAGMVENVYRSHLQMLERFIGQPNDRRMRQEFETFCRRHGVPEGQRVLEYIMRSSKTPEVLELAADPSRFTAAWLEARLPGKAA